jgi:LysM repeat protein
MYRSTVLIVLTSVLLATVVACGDDDEATLETLPPIRTTTTIPPTSTIPPDQRRIFYQVQPNDNLSEIARSYGVPRQAIVDLNKLPDGGETLQIGQVIEIPNDMRLDTSLPDPPTTTTTLEP